MPYSPATTYEFKMRHPEFASVTDDVISYWLTDAEERTIKQDDWNGPDAPIAQMLVAAHGMASAGLVEGGQSDIPAGVVNMRSGSLSLGFDAGYVRDANSGGYASTKYGKALVALIRCYRGGPRVTSGGAVLVDGGWRDSLLTGFAH